MGTDLVMTVLPIDSDTVRYSPESRQHCGHVHRKRRLETEQMNWRANVIPAKRRDEGLRRLPVFFRQTRSSIVIIFGFCRIPGAVRRPQKVDRVWHRSPIRCQVTNLPLVCDGPPDPFSGRRDLTHDEIRVEVRKETPPEQEE